MHTCSGSTGRPERKPVAVGAVEPELLGVPILGKIASHLLERDDLGAGGTAGSAIRPHGAPAPRL